MKQLFILTAIVLLISCNSSDETATQETTENDSTKVEHHEEQHDAGEHDHEKSKLNNVALNDGEKWKANPETTAGIQTMLARVDEFDSMSDTSAYQNLADSLDADFRGIFNKCTMKGEAHNQLHNYLLPMKKMFQQLQAEDQDTRASAFHNLEEHLNEYPVFFK